MTGLKPCRQGHVCHSVNVAFLFALFLPASLSLGVETGGEKTPGRRRGDACTDSADYPVLISLTLNQRAGHGEVTGFLNRRRSELASYAESFRRNPSAIAEVNVALHNAGKLGDANECP